MHLFFVVPKRVHIFYTAFSQKTNLFGQNSQRRCRRSSPAPNRTPRGFASCACYWSFSAWSKTAAMRSPRSTRVTSVRMQKSTASVSVAASYWPFFTT